MPALCKGSITGNVSAAATAAVAKPFPTVTRRGGEAAARPTHANAAVVESTAMVPFATALM